jgi:hypothetical protein
MLGDEPLDGVTAETGAAAAGEDWVGWVAAAFCEPFAQDVDGLPGQWRGPVLSAFATATEARTGAELDVVDRQPGQFGYP